MTTYECKICLNVNHASKLHCSTCGTVPPEYSVLGLPSKIQSYDDRSVYISVVVAYGADRAEHHRTVRTYLRTVPADYYAASV